MSIADREASEARHQTTHDVLVTLRAPHWRIDSREGSTILPGHDDVTITGSRMLRESFDMDIVRDFTRSPYGMTDLTTRSGSPRIILTSRNASSYNSYYSHRGGHIDEMWTYHHQSSHYERLLLIYLSEV